MAVTSALGISERKATTAFLTTTWILNGFTFVTISIVNGFMQMAGTIIPSVLLLLIPTLMHIFKWKPAWVKYALAVEMPIPIIFAFATAPQTSMMWPLWFYSMGPGIYFMTTKTQLTSTVSTTLSLAITVAFFRPAIPPETLPSEIMSGVTSMITMFVLFYLASRRFTRMMSGLEEGTRDARQHSEMLSAAFAKLEASATALQSSAAGVDSQSQRVETLVTESVDPAVDLLRAGFGEQEQALAASMETMQQVAGSVEQLSRAAADQAEAVTRAVATLQSVAATVTDLDTLAAAFRQDAELASRMVSEGRSAMAGSQAAVSGVESTVKLTSDQLSQLGDRSKKIGQVVTLIQEIADQTSLLALNAAIEAARAGEMGRGFAVVADEVRKLADRSSKASLEIAQLIGEVETGIDQSVAAMTQTTATVSSSAAQNEQMAQILTGILEATGRTTARVQEVVTRTADLTRNAGQLTDQMTQLAALAEENSATAEEMLASNTHVLDSVSRVSAVGRQALNQVSQVEAAVKELTVVVGELGSTSAQLGALAGSLQVANA